MRRTSSSTSSRVACEGAVDAGNSGRLAGGSTVTGPILSDMPQRPTICRAMVVTCSRSDSAPVVTSP